MVMRLHGLDAPRSCSPNNQHTLQQILVVGALSAKFFAVVKFKKLYVAITIPDKTFLVVVNGLYTF